MLKLKAGSRIEKQHKGLMAAAGPQGENRNFLPAGQLKEKKLETKWRDHQWKKS
jgi:hypothetical protein